MKRILAIALRRWDTKTANNAQQWHLPSTSHTPCWPDLKKHGDGAGLLLTASATSLPRRRLLALGAGAVGLALLPSCAHSQPAPPGPGMTASVTYLHLLAKTPMFRDMSREQLQWVIDHSREWAVAPGALIASSERGMDRFWTLLDGGWQLEHDGRVYPSGHADPGKWYGGREMTALALGPNRLLATTRSYVMEIEQAALDDMLRRGIPLGPHLRAGLDFYRKLAR